MAALVGACNCVKSQCQQRCNTALHAPPAQVPGMVNMYSRESRRIPAHALVAPSCSVLGAQSVFAFASPQNYLTPMPATPAHKEALALWGFCNGASAINC